MSDIPPIPSSGQMASFGAQRASQSRSSISQEQPPDELEISETGRILSSLGADSDIRADRVAEIRRAIADGTYETPDKIEATVDRLMDVLRSMSVTA